MNRKSLFGRLADSTTAVRTAERQEYFRVHLEPLEDRKMLAAITYFNDDWTDQNGGSLVFGDLVDSTDFGGVSNLTYGIDAFGLESGGSGTSPTIADAIDGTDSDGQLLIGAGTHFESDIVIDQPLSMEGDGQGVTFIYPETTSAATSGDFPTGTHSGIIIQSDRVTIQDLTLDGNGNTTLGTSLHYHHGITTLYDNPGGATVRNGTLVTMQLGPVGDDGNETLPDLDIQRVTVNNVFWHGITMSALTDKTFDTGPDELLALNIWDSTIDNVGPATKTTDHIGILVQNINDDPTDTPGNVGASSVAAVVPGTNGTTISNVGVGVKAAAFGTITGELGNENGANNDAQVVGVAVDNAAFYAYWFQDQRDDSNSILSATQSGGAVTGSIGIWLEHGRADGLTGSSITGYDIGVKATNTKLGSSSGTPGSMGTDIAPFATVIDLVGPGTGVAGSVGLLIDGDATNEAIFLLGPIANISGYEVGVDVVGDDANSDQSILSAERPNVSGNGTDIRIGDNSLLLGPISINSNISVTGTGVINPRTTNEYNWGNDAADFWDGNAAFGETPNELPDKAATAGATDITLGTSATFTPIITGEDAVADNRWDFNNSATYTGLLAPPLNINQSLVSPQAPYGALTVWSGQVTQDGTGALVLGGTATNGAGLGFLYGGDSSVDPNNASVYLIEPESHIDRTYVNVEIKLDPSNVSPLITFGFNDWRANTESWTIPTSILNTSTYTTVTINLMAPSLELTENDGSPEGSGEDDLGIDYGNVSGYVFGGDQGLINGNQTVPLRFSVDNVTFTDQKNAMLEVSGSIDLGGAALSPEIRAGLSLTNGDEFTIVNNTSVGATTTGTFDGLAEGDTVTVGSDLFTISYVAGTDSNDVVLTASGFDSSVTGRFTFYDNSKFDGAPGIDASDSSAIPSKSAYLPGGGVITSASMTSYSRGLNGIFVDLEGTHGTLSLADFSFAVSNPGSGPAGANNTPSTWAAAPAPTAFTVLSDTPAVGTDRVEFIWADGAIDNKYLEVRSLGADDANTNTGLPATDVFYFGHNRGDSFNDLAPTVWLTTAGDETAIQASPIISIATIDSLFDMDRNGIHLSSDRIVARGNTINALNKISIANPPAAPAPPAGDGDGAGSAVASALAAASSSDGGSESSWVGDSLASASISSGPAAAAVAQLAEADSPGELTSSDGGDSDLDSLLDSLLGDLGLS